MGSELEGHLTEDKFSYRSQSNYGSGQEYEIITKIDITEYNEKAKLWHKLIILEYVPWPAIRATKDLLH